MPILNPDHLLEQADQLISPAGGGAPRQADLRRALSTAYYALFHAIVTEAADTFVGKTQRNTAAYSLIYRSIDHRVLKILCTDITKPSLPSKYSNYAPAAGFGPDLIAVASAVVDLQEKRHSADYDPRFRVGRLDAIITVSTARSALLRFQGANRALRKGFLALLVFSMRS